MKTTNNHTNEPIVNIVANIADFDSGLTRNDIKNLKDKNDYWLVRMKEVESINDFDAKAQANVKLLSDMMEDPTLKKIRKGFLGGYSVDVLIHFIAQLP